MFDLFLDIFSYRENALTRLDPRPKIITAFAAILSIILSTHVDLPLATCVICLTCLILLKMPPKLILARLALPLGFTIVLIILQAFTQGKIAVFTLNIMGSTLFVRQEGLLAGFLMGSKVMGSLTVILLLSTVTPAHKIFSAMRSLRVPSGWVELAMLMYRSIFMLLEHASEGACAQRVRLGHLGMRRSLSSMGTLAGSVLLRSLDQAKLTHEAMVLRGYTGSIPFDPMPRLSFKDIMPSFCLCMVIAGVFFIVEWR